jgi:hypothetical protein
VGGGKSPTFCCEEKNMMNDFGLKELYEVSLKLTYPIEVSGRRFENGETLVIFDNV